MSETADQHSMHAAMDQVALEADRMDGQAGVGHVLQHILHRIRRGIADAKDKGASDTQLAYLHDLHDVVSARTHDLSGAAVSERADAHVEAPAAVSVEDPEAEAPSSTKIKVKKAG